jgi:hypothetical protein
VGASTAAWVDAVTGRCDPEADIRYAAAIARAHLGTETVRHGGLLTAFDREYLVIYRLLPVHRFEVADGRGTRVYVNTLTGSVARQTDDAKQFEATVFSLAHKWSFLPRPWRDIALLMAMAGLMLLALGGILLAWMTRRRPPASR